MSDSILVKPGTYYLGDPCYCFEGKKWGEILSKSDTLDEPYHEGNKIVVAFSTAHGDGVYRDQHGHKFPVDAGLIGLVSKSLANMNPGDGALLVKFDKPQYCSAEGGKLYFGPYVIDTDPQDEDE